MLSIFNRFLGRRANACVGRNAISYEMEAHRRAHLLNMMIKNRGNVIVEDNLSIRVDVENEKVQETIRRHLTELKKVDDLS